MDSEVKSMVVVTQNFKVGFDRSDATEKTQAERELIWLRSQRQLAYLDLVLSCVKYDVQNPLAQSPIYTCRPLLRLRTQSRT